MQEGRTGLTLLAPETVPESLVARCATVLTWLGAAVKYVRLWVDQNRLVTTAVVPDAVNMIAAWPQVAHRRFRNTSFRGYRSSILLGGLTGGRGRAQVLDARRFAGFLDVHAEVNEVAEHLHLALGLHV